MQSSITKPTERQDSARFSLNCLFEMILKYCLLYTVDINSFSKGLKYGGSFIPMLYPLRRLDCVIGEVSDGKLNSKDI